MYNINMFEVKASEAHFLINRSVVELISDTVAVGILIRQ